MGTLGEVIDGKQIVLQVLVAVDTTGKLDYSIVQVVNGVSEKGGVLQIVKEYLLLYPKIIIKDSKQTSESILIVPNFSVLGFQEAYQAWNSLKNIPLTVADLLKLREKFVLDSLGQKVVAIKTIEYRSDTLQRISSSTNSVTVLKPELMLKYPLFKDCFGESFKKLHKSMQNALSQYQESVLDGIVIAKKGYYKEHALFIEKVTVTDTTDKPIAAEYGLFSYLLSSYKTYKTETTTQETETTSQETA